MHNIIKIFFFLIFIHCFEFAFPQIDTSLTSRGWQILSIHNLHDSLLLGTGDSIKKISTLNPSLIYNKGGTTCICKIKSDQDGKIWVATTDNMVYCLDDPKKSYTIAKSITPLTITDMGFYDDMIFISTLENGVYVINKSGQNIIDSNFKPNYNNSINEGLCNKVFSILIDNEKTIWLGTERGMYKFIDHDFVKVKHKKAPKNHQVNVIKEYEYNIWAGGCGRLWKYNKNSEQWENILTYQRNNKAIGLKSEINQIWDIDFDSNGNPWFATNKLARYDIINNKWYICRKFKWNDSKCIKVVNDTTVWIGTFHNGLVKFNSKLCRFQNEGNNLIMVIDNSKSVGKRTLNQIKETVKMWVDNMNPDDQVTIISSVKKNISRKDTPEHKLNRRQKQKQKLSSIKTDSILIRTNANDNRNIFRSLKLIKQGEGNRADSLLINIYTKKYNELPIVGCGNNVIILASDCEFDYKKEFDSIQKFAHKKYNVDDFRFSLISYKEQDVGKKFLTPLTDTAEGNLWYVNNDKKIIFNREFENVTSRSHAFYFGVEAIKFSKSKDIPNSFNNKDKLSLDGKSNYLGANVYYCKNDYSKVNFSFGITLGLSNTNFELHLNDYKNGFNTIDVDGDSLRKIITSPLITETCTLTSCNIAGIFQIKYSISGSWGLFVSAGPIYQRYSIVSKYNSIITYRGAYNKWGGEPLPLFNLPEYGLVDNSNLNGSNGRKWDLKFGGIAFVSSAGFDYYLSYRYNLHLLAGIKYFYQVYKHKGSDIYPNYQISNGVGNYNSIVNSLDIKYRSLGWFVGLQYRFKNSKRKK